MDGRFETYSRRARGWAAVPTHDDLTLLVVGWPYAEFEANKSDVEGSYLKSLELAPAFAEACRAAKREARFAGTAVPNYFRKPFGPGWVLVGDAGYNKDFITAQGISDAFRDAEACAGAVHAALTAERPFDGAMADYQSARDGHVCRCTSSRPSSPRSSHRRRHYNSCCAPWPATRKRWTASRA
jgi:2-polyprenyl-6-methoxyphenol hydroxylase-like FAD-dependent oxidoreductase